MEYLLLDLKKRSHIEYIKNKDSYDAQYLDEKLRKSKTFKQKVISVRPSTVTVQSRKGSLYDVTYRPLLKQEDCIGAESILVTVYNDEFYAVEPIFSYEEKQLSLEESNKEFYELGGDY